jgi:hypothetical protein
VGDIYLLVFVEVADFGEDVETKAYVTRMMFLCYYVVHLLGNTYQLRILCLVTYKLKV